MTKLIFYGWEYGMVTLLFIKLLSEKTHLTLKEAANVRTMITDDISYEILIEDDEIAEEVYQKSSEYKVLVRKEVL